MNEGGVNTAGTIARERAVDASTRLGRNDRFGICLILKKGTTGKTILMKSKSRKGGKRRP